ncbi:hypothetical protein [Natrarchaeobius chitinivorans]|uniref:DUF2064 domain-containing protein n=1 Tax=Natrarchaeobius chitinivorans TaxID=1679083 RepID=A0A3N6MKE6_NATCH|nr:hypothetical protein [Natrarchaeobius chitinivorans]RQG97680.1 hypothetical protein EA473_00190 [Natrarchaeobius chitinivorans]
MIVVVPVDPPGVGLASSSLVETTPVTEADAALLSEAAAIDVLRAAAASGGDLLVNYRDDETLPAETVGADPEGEIRSIADVALESVENVRFERQVGSSRSARIGNTVTHLLERESAGTVGVLEPTVPLVGRSDIDGAAMALRRHDVVLGPSSGGRISFAGFAEPVDFEDAYAPPELSTLADRTGAAGLDLGFAPFLPTVAAESGLCATIATLEVRDVAGRPGGEATAAAVEEIGLRVGSDGRLERE